jgi:hypothetical protein
MMHRLIVGLLGLRMFFQFAQQGVLLGRAAPQTLLVEYQVVQAGWNGGSGGTPSGGYSGGGGGAGSISPVLTAVFQPNAVLSITVGVAPGGVSTFNGTSPSAGSNGESAPGTQTGAGGTFNAGGKTGATNQGAGGGGGSTTGGTSHSGTSNRDGGLGGNGTPSTITGVLITYCRGGGGGAGEDGGEGTPGAPNGGSSAGVGNGDNPGDGGGGCGALNVTGNGGTGANGAVFIRYKGVQRAIGGTVTTITVSGENYTLHTYTSSGTFTVDAG